MNMLEKRLCALEQAAMPQLQRSMTDAELAIRLHAILQLGGPEREAVQALLAQVRPELGVGLAEG